jgi:hypothetical protein
MNVPSGAPQGRSARRWVALGAVLAVLVAALVTFALTTRGPDGEASAAAPSSSAASSAASSSAPASAAPTSVALAPAADTPEPTAAPTDADEPPASLSPVALDSPAAVGDGVTAEIVSLEAIDATGVGPGNVSGPALRVTVALTNGTAAPVSLGGVDVELASGPDLAPAPSVNDASAAPFRGDVAAGDTATGVYVFSIAAGDRSDVTVSVGYQAGAPILVFTGDAS